MNNYIESDLKTTIIETHNDVQHIVKKLEAIDKLANNHEKRIRDLELNQETIKIKLVILVGVICALATFLSHYVIAKFLS